MGSGAFRAYVHVAVAKNLNPRCATSGAAGKQNAAAQAAIRSAIGYQSRRTGRSMPEIRKTALRTDTCPAIVDDCGGISGGVGIEKRLGAAVVDDCRVTRG